MQALKLFNALRGGRPGLVHQFSDILVTRFGVPDKGCLHGAAFLHGERRKALVQVIVDELVGNHPCRGSSIQESKRVKWDHAIWLQGWPLEPAPGACGVPAAARETGVDYCRMCGASRSCEHFARRAATWVTTLETDYPLPGFQLYSYGHGLVVLQNDCRCPN